MHRQLHHGWGKGAVAGAVVGLLFPPALLTSAVVGAGGGAVVARLNRSLDRGDIKALGEVMDEGEVTLVALTANTSTEALTKLIEGADKVLSRASAKADEIRAALSA